MSVFAFDNSYARLPERFFAAVAPTPVAAPRLIAVNHGLARQLGLDPAALEEEAGVAFLSGARVPPGAEPLAMAYAGHQFGNFVPQLGDGRAVLLGEVVTPEGARFDIQLKGSGPTPFSRRGDGRAALGPVLREYVVAEAMAALGIPTTRALAAMATGEVVWRETALPGAVLTRVAASHVRVGTFQYFAARGDVAALSILVDHVIGRLYPELVGAETPALALLRAVVARQADLIARWLGVGFIHGVMNTDNMAISGETIDYGPCAFMDAFHPAQVFSSIDQQGRYAYGHQPRIAQWNLARLAETLLPLLDADEDKALALAEAAVGAFAPAFEGAWRAVMGAKIGIVARDDADIALIRDLTTTMARQGADFTLTFRALCDAAADPGADALARRLFAEPEAYDAWAPRWRARLEREPGDPASRASAMRRVNPRLIPRNHQIEAAIAAAIEGQDFKPFAALNDALAAPFDEDPRHDWLAAPPRPEEIVTATFCGT